TGGCHYSEGCNKYAKNGCSQCVVLNSKSKYDLSSFVFSRKKKFFNANKNLIFIAKSNWIKHCAEKSLLTKENKIAQIPNLIDTNIFFPMDKNVAKKCF